MSDAILVLNAGSSSIKFSVFPGHVRPSRQAYDQKIETTEKTGDLSIPGVAALGLIP
jgi:acetate kinase